MKNDGYFKELLERIRDIRASEKMFYRQVLEIYVTSIDYDPKAEISIAFFKNVQNKIHYAIHGQVAEKREQAIDKATNEYKKYKARTFSIVEEDYLNSIKMLEKKTDKKTLRASSEKPCRKFG